MKSDEIRLQLQITIDQSDFIKKVLNENEYTDENHNLIWYMHQFPQYRELISQLFASNLSNHLAALCSALDYKDCIQCLNTLKDETSVEIDKLAAKKKLSELWYNNQYELDSDIDDHCLVTEEECLKLKDSTPIMKGNIIQDLKEYIDEAETIANDENKLATSFIGNLLEESLNRTSSQDIYKLQLLEFLCDIDNKPTITLKTPIDHD